MRFSLKRHSPSVASLILCLILALSATLSLTAQSADKDLALRLKAIRAIEEGTRLIEEGEMDAVRKPNLLDPTRDMSKVHARGREMIEEGKALVAEGETILREIDERIAKERQARLDAIKEVTISGSPVAILSLQEAIDDMLTYLTQELPRKLNRHLFFYQVFYNNQGIYSRYSTLNDWVRMKIEDSGDLKGKIALLTDLNWIVDENHPLGTFKSDQLDPYKKQHGAAIVASELIYGKKLPWVMLNITTSDPENWSVLDQKIWFVRLDKETRQWFGIPEKSTGLETGELYPTIVDKVEFLEFLKKGNQTTHRLNNKSNPYTPSVQFWQTMAKQVLWENKVPINNHDWVRRVFFSEKEPFKILDPRAQMSLILRFPKNKIEENAESTTLEGLLQRVELSSEDDKTGRSLNWGVIKLDAKAPAPESQEISENKEKKTP